MKTRYLRLAIPFTFDDKDTGCDEWSEKQLRANVMSAYDAMCNTERGEALIVVGISRKMERNDD